MHLTNFSLNKNSDNFIPPEGNKFNHNIIIEHFHKESIASKRLLTNIYNRLI